MLIEWNEEKDKWLKEERGLSFADIALEIKRGNYSLRPNPNRIGQVAFITELPNIKHKIFVPAVVTEKGYFLKTAYQSRKETKRSLNL